MNFIKNLFGFGKPKEQEKSSEVKPRRSSSVNPPQNQEHHHHHHHHNNQNQPRSPSAASPGAKPREKLSKESASKDKVRVKKSKQREMRKSELSKEKMETTEDDPKKEERTKEEPRKEEKTKEENRKTETKEERTKEEVKKDEKTKDEVKKEEKTKDDTAVTKTTDDAVKKTTSTPTIDEAPQTTTPEKKTELENDKAPKRPIKPKKLVNDEDAHTDFEQIAAPSRPAVSKSRSRSRPRFSGVLTPAKDSADATKETKEETGGGSNESVDEQVDVKDGKKNEATQDQTQCTKDE